MADLISITPRQGKGLQLSNQVDSGKFRLLLNRICQTLQASIDPKIFSEEEEEKLQISLDLSKDDLSLLLESLVYLYRKAACTRVKPVALEDLLRDILKINDDKIQIFSNAYVTYGRGIVAKLSQQSIFPMQVNDIDWCLNVQTSSSTVKKDVRPIAILELCPIGEQNSTMTVEFNKKEATYLYEKLEKIQAQLDALK